MDSQIPAELLNLKHRFDHWRAHRQRMLERMPDDLRRDAQKMLDIHPPALLRRVLNVDPKILTRTSKRASISAAAPPVKQPSPPIFFQLPTGRPVASRLFIRLSTKFDRLPSSNRQT